MTDGTLGDFDLRSIRLFLSGRYWAYEELLELFARLTAECGDAEVAPDMLRDYRATADLLRREHDLWSQILQLSSQMMLTDLQTAETPLRRAELAVIESAERWRHSPRGTGWDLIDAVDALSQVRETQRNHNPCRTLPQAEVIVKSRDSGAKCMYLHPFG